MKTLWKIKWENILCITMIITSALSWICFLLVSNVYTLAIAVIPSIMASMVINEYDTLKEFRQEVLKNL